MSLPLKVKLEGRFTRALEERIRRWAAQKGVGAKLTVPKDMQWLYWQEFGTPPHDISPTNKPEMIFPNNGELEFRKDTVHHPGTRPTRSITKTMPEVRSDLAERVHEVMTSGALDNPEELQSALIDVAQEAKERIGRTISQDLPGTRDLDPEYGRLGGRTAAEAFEEEVQVTELKET